MKKRVCCTGKDRIITGSFMQENTGPQFYFLAGDTTDKRVNFLYLGINIKYHTNSFNFLYLGIKYHTNSFK